MKNTLSDDGNERLKITLTVDLMVDDRTSNDRTSNDDTRISMIGEPALSFGPIDSHSLGHIFGISILLAPSIPPAGRGTLCEFYSSLSISRICRKEESSVVYTFPLLGSQECTSPTCFIVSADQRVWVGINLSVECLYPSYHLCEFGRNLSAVRGWPQLIISFIFQI